MRRLIVLSGPVASGKSTLAEWLRQVHDFQLIKTHDLLVERVGKEIVERGALQRAGEDLDRRTNGQWVAEAVLHRDQSGRLDNVVLDAVRISSQIEHLRNVFGTQVVHVHIKAPDFELARRYKNRASKFKELASYEEVKKDNTEARVPKLEQSADVVIDSKRCDETDMCVRLGAHIGLFKSQHGGYVDVIVGGQYGSEGKGQVAAYLAPEYDILVRVGGANAGHKVWAKPKPYKFHLLPSGTATSGAKLVLGAGAVITPRVLLKEVGEFAVDKDRLFIDPNAVIVVDDDPKAEKKLVKRISSTGQGIGVATARKILQRDGSIRLAKHQEELKPFLRDTASYLAEAVSSNKRILLEGTQGTALSLHHGEYPYVTSRVTTSVGCMAEAGIPVGTVRRTVMVCRSYPIRVGGPSGPMKSPISFAEISRRSGLDVNHLRKAERTTTTDKLRRIGEFDWELLYKAVVLNSPTDIAITFADYIDSENQGARRFEQLTKETVQFVEEVERVSGVKVSLISTRFHRRAIIDRRSW